ncbi:hypothetical protein ACJJTC_008600 [Scirpophaga incertulas]
MEMRIDANADIATVHSALKDVVYRLKGAAETKHAAISARAQFISDVIYCGAAPERAWLHPVRVRLQPNCTQQLLRSYTLLEGCGDNEITFFLQELFRALSWFLARFTFGPLCTKIVLIILE